jgi:hypothetical protein
MSRLQFPAVEDDSVIWLLSALSVTIADECARTILSDHGRARTLAHAAARRSRSTVGAAENFIYRLRSSIPDFAFHKRLQYRRAPAFFALMFVYLGLCLASICSSTCRTLPASPARKAQRRRRCLTTRRRVWSPSRSAHPTSASPLES